MLEVGDDACDPKQAVAVANQFVNDEVMFVAGHFCSGSSIPASAVYNEEGILQISPASTNPTLTEQGFDNVFRTCGRDDVQGIYAANYVVDNKTAKKIAILHDKSAYGKGLADEFKKELNARWASTEVMYEAITAGDKDFTALITKLKDAGVDLIYHGGYHTEAGLIVRQAREQGFNATLMSGDALVDKQYWEITGPTGEGTLMTFAPDPRKLPAAADVVAKFKAERLRSRGLHALHLRRDPGLRRRRHQGGLDRPRGGGQGAARGQLRDGARHDRLQREGRRHGSTYVLYVWKDGKYAEPTCETTLAVSPATRRCERPGYSVELTSTASWTCSPTDAKVRRFHTRSPICASCVQGRLSIRRARGRGARPCRSSTASPSIRTS